MKNDDDEYGVDDRPMFATGDQDYASARGWNPIMERFEAMRAADRKKNPRKYAAAPEILLVRPAQYFIENALWQAPVQQLFGPFWLYREMAIMFAPPGVGKSVLAMQIAESLCRGVRFAPYDNHAGETVAPQRVLFMDFELTREQFSRRYSSVSTDGRTAENAYQLSPELLRTEHYWDGRLIEGYEDYTDMLFEDITRNLNEIEPTVLIVDNITFLSRGSTANPTVAFRLMERLHVLKRNYSMSILVLAHTPKRRREDSLTDFDLQGSVDLAKVADSAFAIGRSRVSPDLRYIKQLKSRSCRIEHGSDNVAVFRLEKFDFAAVMQPGGESVDNFLGFRFESFGDESDHVALREEIPVSVKRRKKRHDKKIARARTLAASGMSSSEIAAELGVGKTTAYRYLKKPEGRL